jgi:hypothetical protein
MSLLFVLVLLFIGCKSENPVAEQIQDSSEQVIKPSNEIAKETQILFANSWTETDVKNSGSFDIKSEEKRIYIQLSDDFISEQAPDLFIVLVKGKNAAVIQAPYTQLAALSESDYYIVPGKIGGKMAGSIRNINLSENETKQFKWVLFQCVDYNHTFGIAELK